VALFAVWVIVPSGALVRLTASGLGCPDWPLCEGEVVPALGGHALIEFSNRILSAIVMAVCVLTWIVAWRLPGRPGGIRLSSGVLALSTVAQVPLGALTVLTDLHPLMVASHFLLSMVALASGVLLALHAWDLADGAGRSLDRRRGPLAGLVALAYGGLLVTGSLVTASGPHSGDRDVVRRIWQIDEAAYVHVRAAVVFLVLAGVLALWLWREGHVAPLTRRLAAIAAVVIAAQITVGEYQYRNALPWEVVLVHVSLAALGWALIVAIAWSVARPRLVSRG
jgi:cytochrome c oxidase assembly protein subunit 15